MSKKRGFTLVEILVVVAITTLVLAMVGGLLIFMAETSGTLIHKSEELMLVQSIESYLRGKYEKDVSDLKLIRYDSNTDCIHYDNDNSVVFKETNLNEFHIYLDINNNNEYDVGDLTINDPNEASECFIRCKLIFEPDGRTQGNHTYDFIIGINKDN